MLASFPFCSPLQRAACVTGVSAPFRARSLKSARGGFFGVESRGFCSGGRIFSFDFFSERCDGNLAEGVEGFFNGLRVIGLPLLEY